MSRTRGNIFVVIFVEIKNRLYFRNFSHNYSYLHRCHSSLKMSILLYFDLWYYKVHWIQLCSICFYFYCLVYFKALLNSQRNFLIGIISYFYVSIILVRWVFLVIILSPLTYIISLTFFNNYFRLICLFSKSFLRWTNSSILYNNLLCRLLGTKRTSYIFLVFLVSLLFLNEMINWLCILLVFFFSFLFLLFILPPYSVSFAPLFSPFLFDDQIPKPNFSAKILFDNLSIWPIAADKDTRRIPELQSGNCSLR